MKENMRMYWRYFKYVLQHKWFVAVECFKTGLFVHGLTHDLSKFLPSEFFPYAVKFFMGDYAYKYFEVERNFEKAWLFHQRRNRHHWNYWVNAQGVPFEIPEKYVKQMVADWRAMARRFGDTAEGYYYANKPKMILHPGTCILIERLL